MKIVENTIMHKSSILASILVVLVKYNDYSLENGFIRTYLGTLFKSTIRKSTIKKKKLIITICDALENTNIANTVIETVRSEWRRSV